MRAVTGTLDDAELIGEAVRGSDAVLSLLGPTTKRGDSLNLVAGYEHIMAAMHTHGVQRLVVMGTAAIPDAADGKNRKLSLTLAMLRLVQRPVYDAIRQIGELVRGSGLRWTIVRLPFLTDGPLTGHIDAGPVGKRDPLSLSCADVAAYFLAQEDDDSQLHRAPFVTEGSAETAR